MSDYADLANLDLGGKILIGRQTNWGGYSDISEGTLLTDGGEIMVAIKALRIRRTSGATPAEERLRKRFYREVLLWRALRHCNIVPLLGYVMLPEGLPTLVSPWYINDNVIRYLESHPNPHRHSLALDVVSGLEYLHSIPIAHGDLKGENVLVDADGAASLCDFGMSQFVDEANRITGFTTTNANIGGTDRFMCPELLEDQPKTTATDVWALGCLIVQILTDEVPYAHIQGRHALPLAIVRGDKPSSNTNGAIGGYLWSCIRRCWSISPQDRPTAFEVGLRLETLDGFAVPACLKRLARSAVTDLLYSKPRIAHSPDGLHLAIASANGTVSIWDARSESATPIRSWTSQINTPDNYICSVAWSTSQHHLLVVSHYVTEIFEVETGNLLVGVPAATAAVFSPDGHTLAFVKRGLGRGQIFLQDLTAEEETQSTVSLKEDVVDLTFTPNGQRIVGVTMRALIVYNLSTKIVEAKTPLLNQFQVLHRNISISKDGRFALVSYQAYDPEVWVIGTKAAKTELSALHQYQSPTGDTRWYNKVQFGGLRDQLIIALCDAHIHVWERDSAMLVHSFRVTQGHGNGDMSFRWHSADAKDVMLAVTAWNESRNGGSSLQIWSTEDSNSEPETETGNLA